MVVMGGFDDADRWGCGGGWVFVAAGGEGGITHLIGVVYGARVSRRRVGASLSFYTL